ncbi:hypothetical protein Gpo141_00015210, partial [Globisporangium polare]
MVSVQFASALLLAAVATVSNVDALPRVHSGVHRTLRTQGTVDIIATFTSSPKEIIQNVKEAQFASRGDKIASLVDRLEALSKASVADSMPFLSQESAGLYVSAQPFWISNQFFFKGATFELVEKLSALSNLAEIREQLVLPVPTVTSAERNT